MADTRIEELRRRLERDPGSRLFAQLAEELRKGGELSEAIEVARAGLSVHPSYPSARLTLGRALLDSGDAKGAQAELESALRDAPDNILASRYLAQARAEAGELAGAAEQYRKTLQMAPGDKQLQAALEAVLAKQAGPAAAASLPAGAAAPSVPAAPPLPAVTRPPAAPAAPPTPAVPPAARAVPAAPPRAPAPPAPPTPQRPMQPAPQSGVGEEGGELPPTLRIHASQPVEPAASPPPLPPPAPPVRAAPPPIAAASARPLTSPLPEDVPITPEAKTLPGKAVERVEEPPAAPFPSSTLAELYFQQGLADRAAAVYRQLVELEPDNEKARRRLAELEQGDSPALDRATRRQALERTIAGLELLLAAVKRR